MLSAKEASAPGILQELEESARQGAFLLPLGFVVLAGSDLLEL